jgi:hypothetical protein
LVFAFNYGPESYTLPQGIDYVLGSAQLKAYDVAAWRET